MSEFEKNILCTYREEYFPFHIIFKCQPDLEYSGFECTHTIKTKQNKCKCCGRKKFELHYLTNFAKIDELFFCPFTCFVQSKRKKKKKRNSNNCTELIFISEYITHFY